MPTEDERYLFSAPLELVDYNGKLPIRWLTRRHKDEIIERYGQVAWDRIDKVLLVKGYIFESVYNAFNNLSRKDDTTLKIGSTPNFNPIPYDENRNFDFLTMYLV